MEAGERRTLVAVGLLAALVVGIAAGAAAGVLLAPRPGKESRRKLADWLRAKREAGQEELRERKAKVEAAIQAGKEAYARARETPVGA